MLKNIEKLNKYILTLLFLSVPYYKITFTKKVCEFTFYYHLLFSYFSINLYVSLIMIILLKRI